MLISTVCKTHGLSRIRGPILLLDCIHFYALVKSQRSALPRRFDRLLGSRIGEGWGGRAQIDRLFDHFDFFYQRVTGREDRGPSAPVRLSDPVPRADLPNLQSHRDFHRVASGQAPVSLTMACVFKLVAVSRRYQAVYCIQISLSFIITI